MELGRASKRATLILNGMNSSGDLFEEEEEIFLHEKAEIHIIVGNFLAAIQIMNEYEVVSIQRKWNVGALTYVGEGTMAQNGATYLVTLSRKSDIFAQKVLESEPKTKGNLIESASPSLQRCKTLEKQTGKA